MIKIICFFLIVCFCGAHGQDRIFLLNGNFIDCKIFDESALDFSYNTINNPAEIKKIQKQTIDLIKYENGKIVDISKLLSLDEYAENNENKNLKDKIKTDEFKNYINSIAREMSASVLKNIPGIIDNSSYNIYFDLITIDSKTNEINIPIKILYEKYLKINNGFVQATIKISDNGKRKIQITNSGLN